MDTPNPQTKWKNMRRMAWISLVAGLAFPLLLYATESAVLGTLAAPFYLFVGSVVGAYMGFSTWGDSKQ
jgi:hypothetical protein